MQCITYDIAYEFRKTRRKKGHLLEMYSFKILLTAMTSKHASQTFLIAGFLSCIKSIRYPGASANKK